MPAGFLQRIQSYAPNPCLPPPACLRLPPHPQAISNGTWVADNVNEGHMDYFFWMMAVLMALTLVVYVFIARRFRYKQVGVGSGKQGGRGEACREGRLARLSIHDRALSPPSPHLCMRCSPLRPTPLLETRRPGPRFKQILLPARLSQVTHSTIDPEAMALAPEGRGALSFSHGIVRSEWRFLPPRASSCYSSGLSEDSPS